MAATQLVQRQLLKTTVVGKCWHAFAPLSPTFAKDCKYMTSMYIYIYRHTDLSITPNVACAMQHTLRGVYDHREPFLVSVFLLVVVVSHFSASARGSISRIALLPVVPLTYPHAST